MQLYILKKKALEDLKSDISANMEKYADAKENTDVHPWIDDYFEKKEGENYSYYRPTGLAVPDVELKLGGAETDAENAILLYDALRGELNLRRASDLRLWAYLTHKVFYAYMVKRWAITLSDVTDENTRGASSKQKLYGKINSRYFFGASNGKAFVRQGISRLFWGAMLTYDENNSDPYEMTKYIFEDQDRFVATTERTLARNKIFLIQALKVLKENGQINRQDTRAYFAEINRSCGIEVLDALSKENAHDLCEKCLEYVLSRSRSE